MLSKVGVIIGQTGRSSTATPLLVDCPDDDQGVCTKLDPLNATSAAAGMMEARIWRLGLS